MKPTTYFVTLILSFFLAPLGHSAVQKILFTEDFDGTNALANWEVSSTGGGRVRVEQDPRSAFNRGLVMDDGTNDVVFAQNVARRNISIAGHTSIRIGVNVYSFDDEVHTGLDDALDGGFDGVVIRCGAVVRAYEMTWSREKEFEIFPDAGFLEAVARSNGVFTLELHQYDNFGTPDDGLFFDNVVVTGVEVREIYVEAPLVVSEAEAFNVTVLLWPIPPGPVTLRLEDDGIVHGTATYPAGVASAELSFPSFDNNRLDGDRLRTLKVTDGTFSSAAFTTRMLDNERAGLTLTVGNSLPEGVNNAGGFVAVGVPHDTSITVNLQSSDPTILTVPASVTIGRTASSAPFQITTIENPRVLPNRPVTITASVGTDRVEKAVVVTESNSLLPALSGPTNLVEGATNIAFTFSVYALTDEPLSVTLSATPAAVSVQPATVILPPGTSSGSFTVSVAEDSVATGDVPFTITAQTSTNLKSTLTGRILDNEIAGFAYELPDPIQADFTYTVPIRAVNQGGTTVTAFAGRASLYQKDAETGAETLLQADLNFSQGQALVFFGFPYSARGDFFVVRSADGVTSTSVPLRIFQKITFAATDMVYDSKRKLMYAVSGGNAAPGHLHSVTKINPATAAIGEALFLGGDPRNLVITDDGKYIYVGQHTQYAVRRIDLDTFSSVATIILDSDSVWTGDSFRPYRMLALPGRPLDFIVSQQHTSSTYRTTRLYINGVVQPASSWDAVELAPAGADDEFYAYNSQSTGYQFMRLRLIPTGFEAISTQSGGLFSGFSTHIAGEDDLIFSNSGRVVDGLKMEIVADLKFPASWNAQNPFGGAPIVMTPDTKRSRVYYAQGNSIAAYDTGVFQLVSQATLPGIGNITKIVRWEDVGLALLTDKAEVVLMEDDQLVPSGAPTDLGVTISAAPQPVFLGEELTYSISVTNRSDTVARDVRVAVELNAGQTIKSVASGNFQNSIQSSNVVIQIGDMAPGAGHAFTVTTTPSALATLVGTAGALTRSLDRDYANNRATVVLNVGFKSAPGSINVIKMPVNDVLLEPISGQLIVSIAERAPAGAANRILLVDPTSGLITKSIAVPGEPTRLAVSDDGTTVYALSAARNSAFRVSLATEQFVRTISFNTAQDTVTASDIKVLRGTTDSVIIGSGWHGARIYDNGVARAEYSGVYDGNLIVLLPDPNVAFGYNTEHTGFESYKYELGTNGVKILTETGGLFSGFSQQIEGDGYYVYALDGKAVRADLMTLAGTFSLAPLEGGGGFLTTSVEPERAKQRVYFARERQIASFDSEDYLHIRNRAFNLPANITSLERWGSDGFAARLENGELAIIRSDLVPEMASPIDLRVLIPDNLEVSVQGLSITGEAFSGQGISSVKVNGQTANTSNGFGVWSVFINSLVEGENVFTITATAFGAPAVTRTITRKVSYVPEAPSVDGIKTDWLRHNFGSVDAPAARAGADPDADGQSNLAEFLFGTNPNQADRPQFAISRDASGVQVEMVQRATGDFTFTVECSNDLREWQGLSGQLQALSEPVTVPGTTNYVKATYRVSANAPASSQFYRVRVASR